MTTLAESGNGFPDQVFAGINHNAAALFGCPARGWWSVSCLTAATPFETHDGGFINLQRVGGILRQLDPTDIATPIEELRAYLLANYAGRFDIHPKRFEDIVGGVFADFGFGVRVTAYAGDDGIDVFVLDGADNATVGIQVKRYRDTISAEQFGRSSAL
jgi:restriction system protein